MYARNPHILGSGRNSHILGSGQAKITEMFGLGGTTFTPKTTLKAERAAALHSNHEACHVNSSTFGCIQAQSPTRTMPERYESDERKMREEENEGSIGSPVFSSQDHPRTEKPSEREKGFALSPDACFPPGPAILIDRRGSDVGGATDQVRSDRKKKLSLKRKVSPCDQSPAPTRQIWSDDGDRRHVEVIDASPTLSFYY
jgi:hypothetical protein